MPLLVISSPKGGVGKTTVATNLAVAFSTLKRKVVVIDFDVQNAARLHFGMNFGDPYGYVVHFAEENWLPLILRAKYNVALLPYGVVTPEERKQFEHALGEPAYLADRIAPILQKDNILLIADTPPGPSPALDALTPLADLELAVLLADGASVSLLPLLERHIRDCEMSRGKHFRVLLNQLDERKRLNRDVAHFMRSRLGNSLIGEIHSDEAIAEAVAGQRSVFDQASVSAGAMDLTKAAQKLDALLGMPAMSRTSRRVNVGFDNAS